MRVELVENQRVVVPQQHYYTHELRKTAPLKIHSEKLWERRCFDSNGMLAAVIVIARGALIAQWLLDHDREPVADLARGDYRQGVMAKIVS
jgi:hypothetical protein